MNKTRRAQVVENLRGMGLTQALISDPMSIYYLTGYYTEPYERFLGLYLNANGASTLFANRLFPDASAACDDVRTFDDTEDPVPLVAAVTDHGAPLGVDKKLAARWLVPLQEAGAASTFKLGSAAVDDARSVKSPEEQELMRTASRTNDKAMEWLAAQVHEGVTEQEIAGGLLDVYRSLGAQDHSFAPIVSFGANAADPHHSPDGTVLAKGDVVLFDGGCRQDM